VRTKRKKAKKVTSQSDPDQEARNPLVWGGGKKTAWSSGVICQVTNLGGGRKGESAKRDVSPYVFATKTKNLDVKGQRGNAHQSERNEPLAAINRRAKACEKKGRGTVREKTAGDDQPHPSKTTRNCVDKGGRGKPPQERDLENERVNSASKNLHKKRRKDPNNGEQDSADLARPSLERGECQKGGGEGSPKRNKGTTASTSGNDRKRRETREESQRPHNTNASV